MKTPREILLDQHRAVTPRLDRLREKVLKSELSPAMDAPAARKKNAAAPARNFWSTLLSPLRTPGFAVMLIAAATAFAAGWAFHSSNGKAGNAPQTASSASTHTLNATKGGSGVADAGQTLEQLMNEPNGVLQTLHLNRFISSLNEAQVRSLLEAAEKNPGRWDSYEERSLLVARLTELDPNAALAWAQGLKSSERTQALQSVFESWGNNDPKALLAAVSQVSNLNERRDLEHALVSTLASQNPVAALSYLDSLPAGERQPYTYGDVFGRWAHSDPSAAAKAAAALPAGQERNIAMENIAQGWSQLDPMAALNWAQSLPSGQARNNAMSNIMNNLGSQDPQAAIKMLDDLPNNNLRTNLVNQVANNWAQTDPAAALAWVQGADLPVAIQQNVIPNILRQLGETDPQAAIAYVAQIPTGPMRQNAISTVADALAEADAPGALDWAASITDMNRNTQRNVMNNILNTWANNDPAATAAYVQDHWSDPGVSNVANNVVSQWAQSDPTAAFAWANSMPDSQVKTDSMRSVLYQQANEDPAAVWSYLQQLPADDTRFQDVAQSVISNWAQQDPAAAANIVTQLPEGNASRQAYSTLASSWLNDDPMAASQWISTLPDSAERDSAVSQLVSSQSMYEPDTTFAWALTIDDDKLRQSNLRTAARELYRSNPATAQQVIAAALPDDQAATLLQQAQNDVNRGGRTGRINPGGPILLDGGTVRPGVMMKMAPTAAMAPVGGADGFTSWNGAVASGAADDGSTVDTSGAFNGPPPTGSADASAVSDGPPNLTLTDSNTYTGGTAVTDGPTAPVPTLYSGVNATGGSLELAATAATATAAPVSPVAASVPVMVAAPAPSAAPMTATLAPMPPPTATASVASIATAASTPMLPPDSVGGAKIGPGPSARSVLAVVPTGPNRLGKPMIVPPPSKTKTPAPAPTPTPTSAAPASSNTTNAAIGTNPTNRAATTPAVAPTIPAPATSSNTTATPAAPPTSPPASLPTLTP